MRQTFLCSSAIATLILAACSGGDRVSLMPTTNYPTAPTQSPAMAAGAVPDVSGSWNVSGTGYLTVPSTEVQRLFGIQPEGPVTHLRCQGTSTMQLSQSGATFSGTAIRQTISCETGHGHVFVPQPPSFPNSLEVADGLITGRGIHFLFGAVAGLGCPHNGAIMQVEGGRATELTANGRCIIPGHPQSPAPRDPPPAGTSHDTSFVATRP